MSEPGQWLELKGGEALDNIDFSLPRAGVVTVRVTDEAGEPLERATDGTFSMSNVFPESTRCW
jgi:hypothetical protein